MANDEVWRCDLKSTCVKYCESKNNKHQCGIYKRDNMQKYKTIYLLELDSVSRSRDIMKASDICQDDLVFVGDTNYGYYYNLSEANVKKLQKLGADLEKFENICIIELESKEEFLEYIKNNEYIDTETILQSGFPPKDYYNILIKDTECN